MKRKTILKEAGVLLTAAILILTALFVFTPVTKIAKASTTIFSENPNIISHKEQVTKNRMMFPEVVIDPSSWNFGGLKKGETASKRFDIKNIGDDPITVTIHLDTSTDEFWMLGGGEAYLNPYVGDATLTVYFSPKYDPGATVAAYLTVDWTYDNIPYTIKAQIQGKYKIKDNSILDTQYLPFIKSISYSYNIPIKQFWENYFGRFPHAFPILRQLLGY